MRSMFGHSDDYWVSAMDGQPFVVLNQAVVPGLIKDIEGEILPRLDERVPAQPATERFKDDPACSPPKFAPTELMR